jgi:oligoribonuclease (3'-5' exoribonuclease)
MSKSKVIGNSSKAKTLKQISKWLKNSHSDSKEYKVWGQRFCQALCFLNKIPPNKEQYFFYINARNYLLFTAFRVIYVVPKNERRY